MQTIFSSSKIPTTLRKQNRAGWLVILATLFISVSAFGQIQVDLKMDRRLYITHEPVSGTLTIINQSGRDLVFGESNGMSWLDFSITNSRGHIISPTRQATHAKPIVISAGQTYEQKITVNEFYPMATIGVYHVKAVVSFPQVNRNFQSKSMSVQVTDGQPMWSQIVGVPQGHPKAGSYREYVLMTYYHGSRAKALYFRLKDNDSGMVYKTYSIGDYMSVRPPMHHIDRDNRLHVLHMSSPQKYTYTTISIDGDLLSRDHYRSKGTDRPELVRSDYGDVSVVGGISEDEAALPYEQQQFHLLSERPPGMPVVN